jgi:hypothetical protein
MACVSSDFSGSWQRSTKNYLISVCNVRNFTYLCEHIIYKCYARVCFFRV